MKSSSKFVLKLRKKGCDLVILNMNNIEMNEYLRAFKYMSALTCFYYYRHKLPGAHSYPL